MRRISWLVLLALAAGCDCTPAPDGGVDADAGVPPLDGGPTADGSVDAGPPSLVAPPASPELGGCTDGWNAADVDGIAFCDPWPTSGIATCTGAADAHFAGEPGCRAPGSVCDGEWASELPATGVLFVRPLGTPTGTGTMADPFGTIAQAIAAASAGTTIALSAGRFDVAQIDLPSDVRLVGACAERTVLASASSSSDFGVVSVFASVRGSVENLRIEGARPGVFVGAGGSVTVRGVVVDGAEVWGMIADDGGELVAEDVVIRNTRAFGGFDLGEGVYVRGGSRLTLRRAVVERNVEHGIYIDGAGSVATVTDVAVRDIATSDRGHRGVGIWVTSDATATLTRIAIDRVRESAVAAVVDARVTIDRLVARDIAQSTGLTNFGAGLLARASAHIDASRVLVQRASHAGAVAFETGSELTLTDAVIQGTQLAPDPQPDRWGMGIVADDGASLRLQRTASVGNVFLGILVMGGTHELDDVTVRGTLAAGTAQTYGRGLELQQGAVVLLRRASFEDNREISIALTDPGSSLTAEDVRVGDTAANGAGQFGEGLTAVDSASVVLTRADFRGLRGAAVVLSNASLDATGLEVSGTRQQDCALDGRCPLAGAAYDVVVLDRGSAAITTFRFEGAPTAALQLARGGEADLSNGVVADSPVAFNVQSMTFDDARLRTGVSFVSVSAELDRTTLPTLPIAAIPPFGI